MSARRRGEVKGDVDVLALALDLEAEVPGQVGLAVIAVAGGLAAAFLDLG
jgi:hypothetical protein